MWDLLNSTHQSTEPERSKQKSSTTFISASLPRDSRIPNLLLRKSKRTGWLPFENASRIAFIRWHVWWKCYAQNLNSCRESASVPKRFVLIAAISWRRRATPTCLRPRIIFQGSKWWNPKRSMSTPGPSISHYDKPHSQGKQRAFDQGKPPRHWKNSPFCCNHPKRILLFKHPDQWISALCLHTLW